MGNRSAMARYTLYNSTRRGFYGNASLDEGNGCSSTFIQSCISNRNSRKVHSTGLPVHGFRFPVELKMENGGAMSWLVPHLVRTLHC